MTEVKKSSNLQSRYFGQHCWELCASRDRGAGNLRELALARMERLGLKCRDVRTREVGIQDIHHRVVPRDVELVRRDYAANGGWETFLAYEDPRQDILIGLLRLRRLAGPAKERQPNLKGAPPFPAPLLPGH